MYIYRSDHIVDGCSIRSMALLQERKTKENLPQSWYPFIIIVDRWQQIISINLITSSFDTIVSSFDTIVSSFDTIVSSFDTIVSS